MALPEPPLLPGSTPVQIGTRITDAWWQFFDRLRQLYLIVFDFATAEFLLGAANAELPNGRVVTDTATVTWDLTTPGEAKANATGGAASNVAEAFFFGGL